MRLRHAVLQISKSCCFSPRTNWPPSVTITGTSTASVGTLGVPEILGADVVDEPAAVRQRGDDADVMAAHDVARIPGAAERRPLDGAHQPAVDEEAHRSGLQRPGDESASSRVGPLTNTSSSGAVIDSVGAWPALTAKRGAMASASPTREPHCRGSATGASRPLARSARAGRRS